MLLGLDEESLEARKGAVKALTKLPPTAPGTPEESALQQDVLPSLLRVLDDPVWILHWAAHKALIKRTPREIATALPELRERMRRGIGGEEADRVVRRSAVELVGHAMSHASAGDASMQPELPGIAEELVARLLDEECRVQDAAVIALGRLPPALFQGVTPALSLLLVHKDFHMREAAVVTLGHLRGAELVGVLPLLLRRLHDSKGRVRRATVDVMKFLPKEELRRLEPQLVSLLTNDPEGRVKQSAKAALAQIAAATTARGAGA